MTTVSKNSEDFKVLDLETFQEVREAYRCPDLSTHTGGAGQEMFHKDVIVRLDGEEHTRRRRALGTLLKQRGHEKIRDLVLYPTAKARMEELLSQRDENGFAHTNLIQWLQRTNFRMAAAMVGFDNGREGESAERLVELTETMLRGRPSNLMVSTGQYSISGDVQKESIEARNAILAEYYEPSLKNRRELVAKVADGEVDEDDLPNDLITLIATSADPAWDDPSLAEREALFVLNAGTHTTGTTVYWATREILNWVAKHPEDRIKLQDDDFLREAVEETMRLHVVTGGFPRMATAHIDFGGGTEASKDDMVIIRTGPASVDASVFGENALEFDPYRPAVDNVKRYVFGFGLGSHQCLGMPIVMGAKGIDGSLVYLLKNLFKVGLELDPSGPEQPSLESARGKWTAVPPVFAVRFPAIAANS